MPHGTRGDADGRAFAMRGLARILAGLTLLALAGLVHLSLLGPQGLRELGETCMALAHHAQQSLAAAGLEPAFPDQTTFKEFAVRTGRPAREALAAARAKGVYAGYPLGRDYAGLDDALLVAVTEQRTTEEIAQLVEALS